MSDFVPESFRLDPVRDPEWNAVLRDTWIVAGRVLKDLVEAAQEDGLWASYPEIGEHDWEVVLAQLQRRVPPVHGDIYTAAYDRLAARAGRSREDQ